MPTDVDAIMQLTDMVHGLSAFVMIVASLVIFELTILCVLTFVAGRR